MRNKIFGLILAVAMVAVTPVAALAENRGGGHFSGGHNYSAPARGFQGAAARGGVEHFDGGYRGGFHRGGGYVGGGVYVGPGYGYGYAPNPCGYYDAAGYWHADPACYVPPAVY